MKARTVFLLALVSACGSGRPNDRSAALDQSAAAHSSDSLSRIILSETAYTAAGIKVEVARSEVPEQSLDLPGQVEFDPRRVTLITARSAGRVEQLEVVEGDRVRAGQVLARLYSPAFQTAQTDFLLAVRRGNQLAGTPDEPGAASVVRAMRRRLALLGVATNEIARLESGGEPADYLVLAAPFDGSIVEAHAVAGASVEEGTIMFRLADLSVVDVVAQVPERALPLMQVGQAATVGIAAYPDLRFAGRVERLHDELDQQTRTLGAVIHVPNPDRRLRPGMFASVRFQVSAPALAEGPGGRVVTIPETALVTDGEGHFVFVEVASRTFERRAVVVAPLAPPGASGPSGGRVVVRSGVAAGERVVIRGAFTLKSELAKAALAEDEH